MEFQDTPADPSEYLPKVPGIPQLPDVDTLTPEQQRELAAAYIDLLNMMNRALVECETGYGFFSYNGTGYSITGHPPNDLVARLMAEMN